MRRTFIASAVVILCGLWFPCRAQQPSLAGEWSGGLDSGRQWLGIKVRFRGDGTAGGAIDLPQYNLIDQPLNHIGVGANRVHFEWPRGERGTGVFDGEFTEGGLTGRYQRGDIRSTFYLVRASNIAPATYDKYFGNYRLGPERFLTIGVEGDDAPRLSYVDTKTRRTGYLFPLSESEFFAGPTYEIPFPVDFKIAFVKNARGEVTGLRWSQKGSPTVAAPKSPYRQEEIRFRNGEAELTGLLTVPGKAGPHPAIILVRPGYTFSRRGGDVPASFLREGLAVLMLTSKTVDGKSTDYTKASFEERARDVLAGLATLKTRRDIDGRRIGLFGASLGSWVAPIAATLSTDVAFIILQVPPALPVAENIVHEIESFMRDQNLINAGTFSEEDIAKAKALRRLLNTTILTDEGWDTLKSEIEKSKDEKWFGYARVGWLSSVQTPPDAATLKGLRDPISYDPAPILEKLTVPVLTINGGLDPYVETSRSVPILALSLTKAGNKDATVVLLPRGSHGLLESETGLESETYRMKRHVYGYWETISDWLGRHVNTKIDHTPIEYR